MIRNSGFRGVEAELRQEVGVRSELRQEVGVRSESRQEVSRGKNLEVRVEARSHDEREPRVILNKQLRQCQQMTVDFAVQPHLANLLGGGLS
jgi:hypothetical protein